METVEWSEALQLDFAPMDTAHHTFVDLLAQAQTATDAALPTAWGVLLAHMEKQFGEEDRWMRETHFASASNHLLQHHVVLNLLREGAAMARNGQMAPVREMAGELAAWFFKHTQSMDAALALHMRRHPGPASSIE
jgi:hemerythrin-like metal-binding protein